MKRPYHCSLPLPGMPCRWGQYVIPFRRGSMNVKHTKYAWSLSCRRMSGNGFLPERGIHACSNSECWHCSCSPSLLHRYGRHACALGLVPRGPQRSCCKVSHLSLPLLVPPYRPFLLLLLGGREMPSASFAALLTPSWLSTISGIMKTPFQRGPEHF